VEGYEEWIEAMLEKTKGCPKNKDVLLRKLMKDWLELGAGALSGWLENTFAA